ncbi:hypothetical protein KQI36_16065 [Clostridium senegalense]|uniref:hypothetical protein n=1 Tax=Clostridium senegalense TaxID=1465809 RepID=UPI001297B2D9|nr:hypothetical protein [Clostridium senegalense]MBU5228148.1 hypothetical protein [Clostridium senegalense]MPU17047.1 hypothetical protein [Acinetobacter baumannii]
MDVFNNLAIVNNIINDNKVSVLVIGDTDNVHRKILYASSFYIEGLKELLKKEEYVFVNFNPDDDTIIEDGEN